jgi:hypothetical protein
MPGRAALIGFVRCGRRAARAETLAPAREAEASGSLGVIARDQCSG